MKRSWRSLGFALAVTALVPSPGRLAAETRSFSLSFPKSVGGMSLDKVRPPTETSRAAEAVYRAEGMTLTLFVYGGGGDLPDGIESERFRKEFEMTKAAVLNPEAWEKSKVVSDRSIELGDASGLLAAREASFNLSQDGVKSISYLWLAAANHVFFKARFTVLDQLREQAEDELPFIHTALRGLAGGGKPTAPPSAP